MMTMFILNREFNLNVMPDMDLEALGAKVTTYHKDDSGVKRYTPCEP